MNKDTLEHLSAFADGQSADESGRFMAKRLSADTKLQAVWARYHLISECIRNPGTKMHGFDLQRRVSLALDGNDSADAESLSVSAESIIPGWFRPAAGAAFAVVVAISAVVLVQKDELPGTQDLLAVGNQPDISFVTPAATVLSGVPARAVPVSLRSDNGGSGQRLNSYLIRHNQVATQNGRSGVIFLVPIISVQNTEATKEKDPAGEAVQQPVVTDQHVEASNDPDPEALPQQ